MKVFLSHSTKDKPFVTILADKLTQAGITPWLCEVDIDYGANFVAEIEQGLRDADFSVLIWSPDAARSDWTKVEWTSVLAREVSESRRRLGLVLLGEAPVPELLRTKHRIDARTNRDQAVQEAVDWLIRLRDMRQLDASGGKAPYSRLPYDPPDFVGRAETLEKLYAGLVQQPGTFLLFGEPGTGKSTLAIKFAWQHQGAFDAVLFQVCGQRPVATIAGELTQQLGLEKTPSLPPEQQVAEVSNWLRQRRSLLILDDIWHLDVQTLIPGPPVSVLCTSRQRTLPWVTPRSAHEVKSFGNDEVEAIFGTYLGTDTVTSHQDALMDLASRLNHLPIAVVVAADLLRRQFGPLTDAAKAISITQLRNEVYDVPALFKKAVDALPALARKLLQAMTVCVLEGFWLPLAARVAGLGDVEAAGARDQLMHASLLRLLDRERQRFQLHALLRDTVRGDSVLTQLEQRHTNVLFELFKQWETRWSECRECLAEIIPAAQTLRRAKDYRWEILAFWGYETGRRVGQLEAAGLIMKQQEALCRDLGNRAGLSHSFGNQAVILKDWGRLEEAMALLKQQEALCRELGDQAGLSRSFGNQAVILKDWGRLEEAMALLKQVETLCRELGDRAGLSRSFGNQAVILKDWGRLEEAMALYKQQEALCRELGDRAGLSASFGNQAVILKNWGRLEEAMALHKQEEALCRELGDQAGLSASFGNQAIILKDWGRLEEAMAQLKQQEALCRELGDRAGLSRSFGNQAHILQAWDRLEEAMALLKQQEALCRELGDQSGLGFCYWNWGLLAVKQEDFSTAQKKLQQALAVFTDLKMLLRRDAVQAALSKLTGSE